MTDKQFFNLRITIIGAAIFIGGTVLMGKVRLALLVILVGLFLMLLDPVQEWLAWFNTNYPPIDEEKEKEDESK